MPKRPKAQAVQPEPAPQSSSEEEQDEQPLGEELDLSSEEEFADDEGASEEGEEEEQSEDDDEAAAEDGADEDIRQAIAEYYQAASEQQRPAEATGNGVPAETSGREHESSGRPLDPGSDSSEDERPSRNTIGDVPLVWYKDEDHIGYDAQGAKIGKSQRGDKLEQLLARNDSSKALRTIYDAYNDEDIVLSKEELRMIMRIRKGQFPHVEVNPYEPYLDYFSGDVDPTPIINAPEPKRRFIPSKHEEAKIVKLVRAIRKGWIKTGKAKRAQQQQPQVYLLWGDDDQADSAKTGSHLTYIPPAKPKLPGHEESYNPPKEYVPTEEEKAGWELLPPEERPGYVPQAFECLRHVPLYANFIKERFERCLDLYLCPRVRKKRMFIDPKTLVPKLPKPQDLQPFPQTLALRFSGHTSRVRCIAPHPSGQWLASGSDDGTVRLWEVATGRCSAKWTLGEPIMSVGWCPNAALQLLGAAVGKRLVLLLSGLGGEEVEVAARAACKVPAAAAAGGEQQQQQLARWESRPDGGLELHTQHPVRQITWHAHGDYFASVAPTGATQAVLVHQLSRHSTQNPFRKNRGRVQRVAFHPLKPFFFVATQNAVRIYNLAKQALAKKLLGGSGVISAMAVHPSGDHVIVGSEDKRLAWYDLDLSTSPYKALRYHSYAVRGAAFHSTYPLFASSSDDGTAHVFHGRVYADLMTNPLIVPVKILRGHKVVDSAGVLDCAFHPTQPWLFTAGADGDVLLFCN